MEQADLQPGTAASEQTILVWKVHLLREQPWRMLPVALVVTLSFLVSYLYCHNIIMPIVVLLLFASALNDYFFPVSYRITARHASRRTLFGHESIEWSAVRKCYLDDYGVKLSPLPRRSRLETYRGVYLRFGNRREEVIEAVRKMRDAGRSND